MPIVGKPLMTRVVSFGAACAAVALLAGCGGAPSSAWSVMPSAASGMTASAGGQNNLAAVASTRSAAPSRPSAASRSSVALSRQTFPAADTTTGASDPAAEGNFDQNPTTKLPDGISPSVPDSATVVSRDYAQKTDGTVVSLKTGSTVTDPTIVGTQDTPPDPLAVSGGKHFIPVSVSDTKQQMGQAGDSRTEDSDAGTDDTDAKSGTQSGTKGVDTVSMRRGATRADAVGAEAGTHTGTVTASPAFRRGARLTGSAAVGTAGRTDGSSTEAAEYQSNAYGAHWGTSGGQQAIFSRSGRRVLANVLHGVDVSQFQHDVDWGAAKRAGVQAAVIRLGYGYGNGADPKAARNIAGVRQAGLKYGFYWYSYAYNKWVAEQEAKSLISVLRQNHVRPGSTALPIYYDLEAYTWSAHPHPTSPSVYRGIVQAWTSTMRAAGYTNVAVYSYTSYLGSALNDGYIHSQTSWVAQYAGDLGYRFSTSHRSWQYADSGHISGIPGAVDLDAFDAAGSVDVTKDRQITIPDGTYYIVPASNATTSVDVPGASAANSTKLATYSANGSAAQQFRFTRGSDGTYTIMNAHSGKVLDVPGAKATEGARLQQYAANGTKAQRWCIRQGSTGAYYLQSALGNWVVGTASTAGNSTPLELEMPGNLATQRFLLSSPVSVPVGRTVRIDSGLPAGRVMDISGGSTADNAIVDSYSWNGTGAQQFVLTRRGNCVYSIKNVTSGKVVDVRGGGTADGTAVDQYSWNGTQAQLWVMRDAGNGFVNLYNPASGRVLEVPGASTKPGTPLRLYTANGTAAQKWRIGAYTPPAPPQPKPETHILPDGVYRFESASDRSHVMEDGAASRANGANVRLWAWNGTAAQQWRVRNLGSDIVTLQNTSSGKMLDLVAARARNGQNVDQYAANGTRAQKWKVERSGNAVLLRSMVNSRFVLDLAGNHTRDGSNIDVYQSNGTSAQRWYAMKAASSSSSATVLPDGVYRFESATDRSRVAEDGAASRANGANVRLWAWNGTAAQRWRVRNLGSNVVTLQNIASGKMLDLVAARARNGQNVDQYAANGTRAQQWKVGRVGGAVILRSMVNQRFVIDLAGNSTRNGANIDVYQSNGTSAQKWYPAKLG